MTSLMRGFALFLLTLCVVAPNEGAAEGQSKVISWMSVPPAVQQTIMQNVGAGNRMDKVYYVTGDDGAGHFQAIIKKDDGSTETLEVNSAGQLAGATPAQSDSATAKPKLSVPFEEGNSAYLQRDYDRAMKVLTPWAQQGDERAQVILGTLYMNGYGTDPDSEEARKWFKLAAQQGNPTAQYNMGILAYNGDGGEQDDVEAYMWFTLAQKNGHKTAGKQIKTLIRKMPAESVKEAQERANKWKPEKSGSDQP
ncbi:MAG TPA: tetratricopeptide repeat protein [Patescibacteria group bacterium]|nr:tetratricopeptide repeat protein [Patescibacteria group bacterium]